MTTPRPVRSLVAVWLLVASAATGATPLLPQLADPVAVAVREHPRGGVEVVAADGPTGVVASVVLLGEVAQRERTLLEHGGPVTALGWAPDGALLVAGEGVTAYDLEGEEAQPVGGAKAAGPLHALAAGARYVFAVGEGALWRSRLVDLELATLRRWPKPEGAVAAVFHPRGYLAVLMVQADAVVLGFVDPERPDDAGVAVPVRGLSKPVAIAYGARSGAAEPSLYALQSDGLFRLDAEGTKGQQSGSATRVAPLEGARAMAFGPDGAVYVISTDGDQGSAVVRLAEKF